jgi:hypothetical protein
MPDRLTFALRLQEGGAIFENRRLIETFKQCGITLGLDNEKEKMPVGILLPIEFSLDSHRKRWAAQVHRRLRWFYKSGRVRGQLQTRASHSRMSWDLIERLKPDMVEDLRQQGRHLQDLFIPPRTNGAEEDLLSHSCQLPKKN